MAAIHFHFAFERRTTLAKGLPHSWAHVHAYRKAAFKTSQREGEGGEVGQGEGNIVASRARWQCQYRCAQCKRVTCKCFQQQLQFMQPTNTRTHTHTYVHIQTAAYMLIMTGRHGSWCCCCCFCLTIRFDFWTSILVSFLRNFPSFFSVALRCGLPSVMCECVSMCVCVQHLACSPVHTHTHPVRYTHSTATSEWPKMPLNVTTASVAAFCQLRIPCSNVQQTG